MIKTPPKTFHETFANFFEQPTRHGLREFLRTHVGEFPNHDFKGEWPDHSSLAKHILGIANEGGGCVVAGVAEREDKTFEPVGLGELADKTNILSGVRKYLPAELFHGLSILDFAYNDSEYAALKGKKFQVMLVASDARHLPYVSTAQGTNIRKAAIYVRTSTATEEADHEALKRVLNRRVETRSDRGDLTVEQHVEHLKTLYDQLDRNWVVLSPDSHHVAVARMASASSGMMAVPNPYYPIEGLDQFIANMIQKKKARIAIELDVDHLP